MKQKEIENIVKAKFYCRLKIKNETISKEKNKIVIKTSINCSFVASPPKTALNDSLSFRATSFGCRSFTTHYTLTSYKKVTYLSIQVFGNEIINRLAAKSNDKVNLLLTGVTLF